MVIWVLVAFPLTVLGGIAGKNRAADFQAPCRTTKYPREIPPLPWYRATLPQMLCAGFLPFSAVYIELYYVFATVWGHKLYTIYSVLFIVFVLLLITTAFITIALTYFQLAVEDHRWWWRSVLCGGSTGRARVLGVLLASPRAHARSTDDALTRMPPPETGAAAPKAAPNSRRSALSLKSSRIFFGRNKLIAAALGRTASDEFRDGLSKVSSTLLGGEAGLLFTNESTAAVRRCFETTQVAEYARAGTAATRDVSLEAGPLNFPHSMEPYLRKLGLATQLANGVVTLLADHAVCREGDMLNGDQAKLLQLLDIKMAMFSLTLRCCWSATDFVEM